MAEYIVVVEATSEQAILAALKPVTVRFIGQGTTNVEPLTPDERRTLEGYRKRKWWRRA